MLSLRAAGWPALLVVCFSMGAETIASDTTSNDVRFAAPNGVPLYLDADIPSGEHLPAAIVVHGGGWVRGDRRTDVEPLRRPLVSNGIAWFSIDYRLCSNILEFGSAIDDVRSAIRFVKSNAARYRVDPERVALIGESAGGQLAAMAALESEPGTQVKAVVALYAPTDLVDLAKNSAVIPEQIRSGLRGTPFEDMILARLGQLSPVDNVGPNAPPFLLIHGTADALVPYAQSTTMCSRMNAAGASCELFTVRGGGHGIRWWESAVPREAEAYKREMIAWLRQHLAA